jgi:hypothetical protein
MLAPSAATIVIARRDRGNSKQDVENAHDHVIDLSSVVPGDRSKRTPQGEGDAYGYNSYKEADSRSVNDAGKDIPAKLIGPEPVVHGWRHEPITHVHLDSLVLIVRDEGGKEGDKQKEPDEHEARHRRSASSQPLPRVDKKTSLF